MSNRKFTDDDVIKALKVHSDTEEPCLDKCPYSGNRYCGSKMASDALALIYNQKAKIKALQMDNEQLQSDIVNANMNLDHAQAEIERLQAVHADMTESLRLASEANKDMQAKIERLKKVLGELKMETEMVYKQRDAQKNRADSIAKFARAEAIKEFAWRLKNRLTPYPEAPFGEMVGSLDIDALVEEMTEDNNESQNT